MITPGRQAPIMERLEDRVLLDAACSISDQAFNAGDGVDFPTVAQGESSTGLVVVDPTMEDAPRLLRSALSSHDPSATEVLFLSPTEDGILRIGRLIRQSQHLYDSIHIIADERFDVLQLGKARIDRDSIRGYVSELVSWRPALADTAQVIFHGSHGEALGTQRDDVLRNFADYLGASLVLPAEFESTSSDLVESSDGGTSGVRPLAAVAYDAVDTNYLLRPTEKPSVIGTGGAGTTGFWQGAGTQDTNVSVDSDGDGVAFNDPDVLIDARATVVEVSGNALVSFDTVTTENDLIDDMRVIITGGGTATIQWEFFDNATGAAAEPGQIALAISDLDGLDGNPKTVEGVAASLDNLTAITLQDMTNVVTEVEDGFLAAYGTENQNDEQASWARFEWQDANQLTLTYYAYTIGARFYNHDGDGDLVFSDPSTHSVQSIDLDFDNSSGAPGADYWTSHRHDPAAESTLLTPIADDDVRLIDLDDNNLQSVTVVLLQPQEADELIIHQPTLEQLGMTVQKSENEAGDLSLNIEGAATLAAYEEALRSVHFSNTSSSADIGSLREIEVQFSDGQNLSPVAVTSIRIDQPVVVDPEPETPFQFEGVGIPSQVVTDLVPIEPLSLAPFFESFGEDLTFEVVNLPPGLVVDPNSGRVTGIPAADASIDSPYVGIVTVTTNNGDSTWRPLEWQVIPASEPSGDNDSPGEPFSDEGIEIPTQTSIEGETITPVDFAPFFNGFTNEPTFDAVNLPPGLIIEPTTGTVTGTPVAGSSSGTPYETVILIAAGDGSSTWRPLEWTIEPSESETPDTNDDIPTGFVDEGLEIPMQFAQETVEILPWDASSYFADFGVIESYSSVNLPSGLTIDSTSGLVTGAPQIGSAVGSPFYAVITVVNAEQLTTWRPVTWSVEPVDVSPSDGQQEPTNEYPLEGVPIPGQSVVEESPIDPFDVTPYFEGFGDSSTYEAIDLPPGLSIDPVSGIVTGTPGPASSDGSPYNVVVTATTSSGSSTWRTITWEVLPLAIVDRFPIEGLEIPGQTVVEGKRIDPLDVSPFFESLGGPVTYEAMNLPPGLRLDDATGIIEGTPQNESSEKSPYLSVITASTTDGLTTWRPLTWTVVPVEVDQDDTPLVGHPKSDFPDEGVEIPGPALTELEQLPPFDLTPYFNGFGSDLTFDVVDLPSWLDLEPSTGIISGTPVAASSVGSPYTSVVVVENGSGDSTWRPIIWSVQPAVDSPIASAYPEEGVALPGQNSVVGEPITPLNVEPYFASFGDSSITYHTMNLPPGLELDADSGLITGVPNRPSWGIPFSTTVFATDGGGDTTWRPIEWTVESTPVTHHGGSSVPGADGALPPQSVIAKVPIRPIDLSTFYEGEGTPTHFQATNLPPGLSIDPSTGVISGTPEELPETESFQSTVVLTNGSGDTEDRSIAWRVEPRAPSAFEISRFHFGSEALQGGALAQGPLGSREVLVSESLLSIPDGPVIAGRATPETVLTGRIYGSDGSVLDETTVVASAAGNWVMAFSKASAETDVRIMIEHVITREVGVGQAHLVVRQGTDQMLPGTAEMKTSATASSIHADAPHEIMRTDHSRSSTPLGLRK